MNKESGLVLEVTSANIEETIKNNPSLVVDCWAPWCGPCRMMSPVIDELAMDYQGKITFGKMNTDENQAIAGKYDIQAIPTLLIFKDGKMTDRKVGALPRQILESELNKNFNS
jgi:thioredoxin 1